MDAGKFRGLFQECFADAITSEQNIQFIRNVFSGELNVLSKKIDFVAGEAKVAEQSVARLSNELKGIDGKVEQYKANSKYLEDRVGKLAKDVKMLAEKGITPVQAQRMEKVEQTVNNMHGEIDRLKEVAPAQAENPVIAQDIRALSSKVQQLEASST